MSISLGSQWLERNNTANKKMMSNIHLGRLSAIKLSCHLPFPYSNFSVVSDSQRYLSNNPLWERLHKKNNHQNSQYLLSFPKLFQQVETLRSKSKEHKIPKIIRKDQEIYKSPFFLGAQSDREVIYMPLILYSGGTASDSRQQAVHRTIKSSLMNGHTNIWHTILTHNNYELCKNLS